jgi:hypothetical protein
MGSPYWVSPWSLGSYGVRAQDSARRIGCGACRCLVPVLSDRLAGLHRAAPIAYAFISSRDNLCGCFGIAQADLLTAVLCRRMRAGAVFFATLPVRTASIHERLLVSQTRRWDPAGERVRARCAVLRMSCVGALRAAPCAARRVLYARMHLARAGRSSSRSAGLAISVSAARATPSSTRIGGASTVRAIRRACTAWTIGRRCADCCSSARARTQSSSRAGQIRTGAGWSDPDAAGEPLVFQLRAAPIV